MTADIHSG